MNWNKFVEALSAEEIKQLEQALSMVPNPQLNDEEKKEIILGHIAHAARMMMDRTGLTLREIIPVIREYRAKEHI